MKLSDNLSILFSVPQTTSISTLQTLADSTFFYDLKLHFRRRPGHWKEVKKYRHLNWKEPDNQYRMDGEINYIKDNLRTLRFDLELFLNKNPDITAEEGAKMFCEKWKGYEKTYGVEFVKRAMMRCKI